jgi:uncharacterized OsmC-like protein
LTLRDPLDLDRDRIDRLLHPIQAPGELRRHGNALLAVEARFLVVGAHALAVHGVPRATGDLDVWIAAGAENVDRVYSGLIRFGAPMEAMGVRRDDLARPDTVVQIGLPPRRIDILTSISGVGFEEAWPSRVTHDVSGLAVPFLGRAALGSCLAFGYAMWAARLGVPIDALEVVVEADYDSRGELGVADDVPPGYLQVRYRVNVTSPAPEEDVRRLVETADRYSPYRDVFARAHDMRRELVITAPQSKR